MGKRNIVFTTLLCLCLISGCKNEIIQQNNRVDEYLFLRTMEFEFIGDDGYGVHQQIQREQENCPDIFHFKDSMSRSVAMAYDSGYRNGNKVICKLERSPVSIGYYLSIPKLSPKKEERAYVYGWYSACYDYFVNHSDHGHDSTSTPDPVSFYRSLLSQLKELEESRVQ